MAVFRGRERRGVFFAGAVRFVLFFCFAALSLALPLLPLPPLSSSPALGAGLGFSSFSSPVFVGRTSSRDGRSGIASGLVCLSVLCSLCPGRPSSSPSLSLSLFSVSLFCLSLACKRHKSPPCPEQLSDIESAQALPGRRVSYDDLADRTTLASDTRHKFLTYQLPTLEVWPTVALMGDGFLGFDSGKGD